jgi:hypothetical protein
LEDVGVDVKAQVKVSSMMGVRFISRDAGCVEYMWSKYGSFPIFLPRIHHVICIVKVGIDPWPETNGPVSKPAVRKSNVWVDRV